jgi:predicted FMN-binding regulatory protein PaiB
MYPPAYHVEHDRDKIHRVIEAFPLATLISRTDDDVVITPLPLILDRSRGAHGVLVGHIDNNNPHLAWLDDRPVAAVFRGPDAYISPSVYSTPQLPTWNYIAAHVRGTARLLRSADALRDALIAMATHLKRDDDPWTLTPDHARMNALLAYITGFEIEITGMVGRFKLSQDKNPRDIGLAKRRLMAQARQGCDEFIESLE